MSAADKTTSKSLLPPDEYERQLQHLDGVGQQFHPEFVGTLGDIAQETVRRWLKDNHIPDQVIYLIDECIMLERWESWLRHNDMPKGEGAELIQCLPEITQLIISLGGVFEGGGLKGIPQESVQWQPDFDQVKKEG